MRILVRIVLYTLLLVAVGGSISRSEPFVSLNTYTCSDFLEDAKAPADGARLLRSLMMIAWSAGYAAAFQAGEARADPTAIQLIAATLGNACRKKPEQLALTAIVDQIKQLANDKEPQSAGSQLPQTPVPAHDNKDFKSFDDFDLPKGDIRTLKDASLNDCTKACKADQQCKAFSYDKWNKWCFLKSQISALTLDPSSISGVRTAAADPPQSRVGPRFELLASKALRGGDEGSEVVETAQECQARCDHDNKCLGFTFLESNRQCHLYADIKTIVKENQSRSGYKTQSAP